MARTMSIDNTDIYRAVVDVAYVGDRHYPKHRVVTSIYGPHDSLATARNWNSRWDDGKPTRVRKQKLVHSYYEGGKLVWADVKTTYTNGGEDVDWDE